VREALSLPILLRSWCFYPTFLGVEEEVCMRWRWVFLTLIAAAVLLKAMLWAERIGGQVVGR